MMSVTKEETRGAHRYYGQFFERSRVISMMFILKTGDPGEAVVCYDFVKEEWFNLDGASFDAILASGKLSEEREKHALWYLEQAQAFNGKGDDEAVEALLRKWTEKKDDFRKGFDPGWPAKYVETSFCLKGKAYSITPDSIGLERGEPWDEGFLEFLQGRIGEDLKELGAAEIRHMGFLD